MKILLVEDNSEKADQIISTLSNSICNITDDKIDFVGNKEEAIDLISTKDYTHIVLDMSLPIHKSDPLDIKHLAGKDILIFMRHRRIYIPTIVLTQHDVFGQQDTFIGLKNLREELTGRFHKFLTTVLFWDNSQQCQNELESFINGTHS